MHTHRNVVELFAATFLAISCGSPLPAYGQEQQSRGNASQTRRSAASQPAQDPAADAMATQNAPNKRPEQKMTEHDRSPVFDITKPAPITTDLKNQPKAGRITGFDFARDPLNSDQPFTTFDEVMKKESAAK